MDKLTNMSVYVKVVEMGSFTAVANHLDSTVGNVSRAVSALENVLDTRLLQRSTRRLSVTDAGRRFYERCTKILADLENAEAEASNAALKPRGTLRVHCVPGLARQLVTSAVLEYRREFPEVTVDLLLSQRMPNLLEDQLDVSILIARTLPDSAYVSQKIGVSHCVLVASPAYLERHPAPVTPEDLNDHQCLLLGTVDYVRDEWQLKSKAGDATFAPQGPSFSVNDMDAMASAIREGAGIGLLAGFSAIEDLRSGRLVRVLPEYHTYERNVYAVYTSRQFIDAKITRFIETLKNRVGTELMMTAQELIV
ncbi:LysR family transcriptional regulator [Pseudomonas fluorescens]|jgi:DNA-binding transcriptional LysR family regulator|uniref:LysR family transcriptional regulator n=1 Tax=Pseudomonas veronii TaxID=76761 RepID=A0A5M8EZR9_PSEVE|nr:MULTISPECIES: LysR family transcriptional regulator [Pseudomonas]AOE68849.1 LysR family transcriptional regulator [Pseudomonas fluorescens]AOE74628.1 LysR family transcriptional regulator [Pseudomonas fluorescens]KAA6176091.1 LysR family transcriptional regulator [Pseudomonas veronii]KAA6182551.1 LysR family transcriptional regulator [Pseudomonas veronii]PMX19983.1 LysR family transcriptional regulator [Pseudomonas sp. GW460-12]